MITAPSKNDRPMPDAAPQPSREHGILVVADDEVMRDELNTWLIDQGYRVWLVPTGPEAIDLYTHHRDAISVVLMDVNLPIMNGTQTLAALRELNPQVCCCFLNGDLTGYSEADLLKLGARAVVRKPFRVSEIGQRLWKLAAPIQRQTSIQDDLWRDDGGQG